MVSVSRFGGYFGATWPSCRPSLSIVTRGNCIFTVVAVQRRAALGILLVLELNWTQGYGFSWAVILVTTAFQIWYFRKRGWL